MRKCLLWLSLALCLMCATPARAFPVDIQVDAARTGEELKPIWRFFGGDEPNYATMRDGRRLVGWLGELAPGHVYFRTHNLLNTGDGTPALKWGSTNAYTEDATGRPVYDWTIVDHIFDTYLTRGVRPYVQLGFMPQALSLQPEPYQSQWRPGFAYDMISGGWSYPPRDYARWEELAYQWTRHCVERYGRAEVETWYWEVWNEANLPVYWKGSAEDFYKLHDYAIAGVRRALPTARVGGPDVAGSGGAFMEGFLDHVATGVNYATGQRGTPLDFVSFHAKGAPTFVDGHVRMGIAAQLQTIDRGFALIGARPALRRTPIVIGESDPDGCAACQGPQLGYRNSAVYASYTAASFSRIQDLAQRRGVNIEGALTWAFEFEDQPYFAGFRQLSSNGLALPVLNVFRMLSMMEGRRLSAVSNGQAALASIMADGVRERPDVGVQASLSARRLSILVWHYHDDDVEGPPAEIRLQLAHLPAAFRGASVTHYRVDGEHSNSYEAWRRMGSPAPNQAQYLELERAGALGTLGPAAPLQMRGGGAEITFTLPRHGVSLLVLDRRA